MRNNRSVCKQTHVHKYHHIAYLLACPQFSFLVVLYTLGESECAVEVERDLLSGAGEDGVGVHVS